MIKILFWSLILLLLLIPNLVTQEHYVVDSISKGIIRIEALDSSSDKFQYISQYQFPNCREGDVVIIKMVGSLILNIRVDQDRTQQRHTYIKQLLNRINTIPQGPSVYD